VFPISGIIAAGCKHRLSAAARAAYDAPFASAREQAGARVFPQLVPARPDDPAAPANRAAWQVLARFDKPFLTLFSDGDPLTRGLERQLQRKIPGAKGQAHATIHGAGHFLQEDAGEELAQRLIAFVRS
jgi:haloalkane dehalogenase